MLQAHMMVEFPICTCMFTWCQDFHIVYLHGARISILYIYMVPGFLYYKFTWSQELQIACSYDARISILYVYMLSGSPECMSTLRQYLNIKCFTLMHFHILYFSAAKYLDIPCLP